MKALLLQQGHTVFCKTLREASRKGGFDVVPSQAAQHRRNTIIRGISV